MSAMAARSLDAAPAASHEAFLHRGDAEFVEGAASFVREALERGEPVLVVLTRRHRDQLRSALRRDAAHVRFGDMEEVGANPARIIPAWRAFVDEVSPDGRPIRGIGEPIWPARRDPELAECHVHESLLNRALEGTALRLLCPYDLAGLRPEVVARAQHTHPLLSDDGTAVRPSPHFAHDFHAVPPPDLPAPPPEAHTLRFDASTLGAARRMVSGVAAHAGMRSPRIADLAMAANEAATNSVRHGGGTGTLLAWSEPDRVVCEVRDGGRIAEPMVGRIRPRAAADPRGLWLANALCDLVQVRTGEQGSVVRLHMRRD